MTLRSRYAKGGEEAHLDCYNLNILRLLANISWLHRKREFCGLATLMESDICLTEAIVDGNKVEVIMVKLKCPKESRKTSVTVELFYNRTNCCPICVYRSQGWSQ